MSKFHFLLILLALLPFSVVIAQEEEHNDQQHPLKRHKVSVVFGDAVVHGVHNTTTGKEQYELVPSFGLDYEYWLSHKWAVGAYNEVVFSNILVEHEEQEFIERETSLLMSGVLVYEPVKRLTFFAGTGFEKDPNHTLMIAYLGAEYAFIRCDDWEVSLGAGYISKEHYDAFTFGIIIGRRFGKNIPTGHHH